MNLAPDHLRFEFYVRYFGVEEALRMTSDAQGLAIARALIERDLNPERISPPAQSLNESKQPGASGRNLKDVANYL